MTPLGPGIHHDVPSAVYHADCAPAPSLNQTLAKVLVDQSPRHAWVLHPRLNPNFEADEANYRKERAIGNAAHALTLGRGKQIAVAPSEFTDWKKSIAQQFREAALEAGKEPILAEHYEDAVKLSQAATAQLDACGWTEAFQQENGDGEVVLVWEEDGLWFRCMVDWLPKHRRAVYDLKTGGGSFAPHVVGIKLVDDGWDVQAAMIERGLAKLDPKNAGRRLYRFVAQENYEPYALVCCELTEAHLTMGRKKLDVAIDLWRMCITTNKWPSYPARVVRPDYPQFKEAQWLEREVDYAANGIGNGERFTKAELYAPAEVES